MENFKTTPKKSNSISKTMEAINKIKNPDKAGKKNLENLLDRIPEGIGIEYMVKGKIFNISYNGEYFEFDDEEYSKSSILTCNGVYKEANNLKYNIHESITNLSFEKELVIKEMVIEEIIDFRDDVNSKEDIDDLDLGELLDKYYDSPLEELDRIHNNFFSIGKGISLSKENVLKICNNIENYGNVLENGEEEIGGYFLISKVGNYCHSFVKTDDNNYECIYSNSPV